MGARIGLTRYRRKISSNWDSGCAATFGQGWVVQRAADGETGPVQYVGVNHSRRNVSVAEQLLHATDVLAFFQQVGGEAVSKGVAAGGFAHICLPDGELDRVLQIFFRDMMAAYFFRARVAREFGCWKKVLPRPGALGVGIFA